MAFELYKYNPSVLAAAIFCVIFLLSALLHGYQIGKYRTWYFIAMLVGALMEGIGYIGRILSHDNIEELGPYIMQSLLLLVAPALFAASIYVVLGRIIVFIHGEHLSPVRVSRLTKVFVSGDVVSFFVQGAGGGIMAQGDSKMSLGKTIILVGLFIQIAWFGLFVVVSIMFHRRINKNPTPVSENLAVSSGIFNWRILLYVLYTASALILVRSIFRVVEYVEGFDGYLMRTETWLYVFDAALMSLVVLMFNVFHPSRVLPAKKVAGDYELSSRY